MFVDADWLDSIVENPTAGFIDKIKGHGEPITQGRWFVDLEGKIDAPVDIFGSTKVNAAIYDPESESVLFRIHTKGSTTNALVAYYDLPEEVRSQIDSVISSL